MAIGTLALVSCEKGLETTQESMTTSNLKKTDKLVYGVFVHSTGVLDLGFCFEEMVFEIEQYAQIELGKEIVVEQLEIEDYNGEEPMFHLSYFDVSKDISVNQWVDLNTEDTGDTIFYYTDKPNPGLWNISKFTCTGKCQTPCKVEKVKEGDETIKRCSNCPDEIEGHVCVGETHLVDVISYVFDQIAKLSPFASLFGGQKN